jgi:hypothetical protein
MKNIIIRRLKIGWDARVKVIEAKLEHENEYGYVNLHRIERRLQQAKLLKNPYEAK